MGTIAFAAMAVIQGKTIAFADMAVIQEKSSSDLGVAARHRASSHAVLCEVDEQSMEMDMWEIKEKLAEIREQMAIRAYEEDRRREELNHKIEEWNRRKEWNRRVELNQKI
ncbi:hypothetical protein Tco_0421251 [Tanacetum coccineum]